MQIELNKKTDNTIELTITIPWSKIKPEYDKIVDEAVKNITVKGFRKGKAPINLAEKQLDCEKVWQAVLEKIIPQYYAKALQKEEIKPIINPQIQLLKSARENDLVFKAETAQAPEIKLGEYKIKKEPKIWTPASRKAASAVPNQRPLMSNQDKSGSGPDRISLDDVLKKLLETTKIILPQILVQQQTNRNLTQLIDQVKQLGMTIAQYAQSKGKTVEQIRADTQKEAENTLKLEFILEKVADVEKVVVEDKEIDEFIAKLKDEKEKEAAKNQRYYIASVLRRQKTLKALLK